MKKRVAILGATGSIGKSALDVISRDPDRFEVVLLTAYSREEELKRLKTIYPKAICVLANKSKNISNREHRDIEELNSYIKEIQPDITLNGIAGAAGLKPSIAAIEAGSALALANKETIVMAGELVLQMAKEKNVKIIPVDSEHSAVFNLLEAFGSKNYYSYNNSLSSISELILTASGGPFRNYSKSKLEKVTLEDALLHPTWNMGKKITIDSASMANKGLEVIEAKYLFNMPQENIKVVIHPQSIIHSMIRLTNGVIYAEASKPDMKNPIANALYWPDIFPPVTEPLNFDNLTLQFEKNDNEKFPMLPLAYEAARLFGLYPCAYNAANEEAVSFFIKGECGFTDIPKITEAVLQKDWSCSNINIESVLEADKNARREAVNLIKNRG